MESLHEILRIATNQEQKAVQARKSRVDRLSLLQQKINSKVSQASKSTKWASTTQDRQSHLQTQSWNMDLCSLSSHMLMWFMIPNDFSIPGKWKNGRQLAHPVMLAAVWALPYGTWGGDAQKHQLPLASAGEQGAGTGLSSTQEPAHGSTPCPWAPHCRAGGLCIEQPRRDQRSFLSHTGHPTAVCDNCFYPTSDLVSVEAWTVLLEGQVPLIAWLLGERLPAAAILSPAAPLSMRQVNREWWKKVNLKQILHAHSSKQEEHRAYGASRELLAEARAPAPQGAARGATSSAPVPCTDGLLTRRGTLEQMASSFQTQRTPFLNPCKL